MTEMTRTDAPTGLPRWLILTLATLATLIGIGALWALAPSSSVCDPGFPSYDTGILPGPQPCGTDGTGPALVTAGILATLLAVLYIVAFTVVRRRGRVLLIVGGVMLFVLIVGLIATVTAANMQPPVIYY